MDDTAGNANPDEQFFDPDEQFTSTSYPYSVAYLIAFEFFERFAYFGLRAILTLYLSHILKYDRETSHIISRVFILFSYALCLVGAIISDNWLGRFKSIVYLAILYAIGSFTLVISEIDASYIPERVLTLSSLTLIVLTSSGLQSLLPAFGGDQFKLPEQIQWLSDFFSMYYFAVSLGSLFGTLVVWHLRMKRKCFERSDCHFVSFLVPAIMLTTGICIMFFGRRRYKHAPKFGQMITVSCKAIVYAISTKWKSKEKRDHWLDYAEDKFDGRLINDLKVLIRFVLLYIPLPIFWSLHEQQDSRWASQARRMDGDMGRWHITPDQWNFVNALLVLVLIPLFNIAIYPLLSIIGIRRPLQKMTIGGIIAGISFLMSAALEFQLEKTDPILPVEKNAQLRIFNGELCDYDITTNIKGQEKFILKSLDAYTYKDIDVPKDRFLLKYTVSSADGSCPKFTTSAISIPEKTAYTLFLNSKNSANPVVVFKDNVEKPMYGLPYGRVLANIDAKSTIYWTPANHSNEIIYEEPALKQQLNELELGIYAILVNQRKVIELEVEIGGSYTIVINESDDDVYRTKVHLITEPNSIHLIWQLPQYFFLSIAEVMYAIPGIEFSYTQSPMTMKSLIQACWVLTRAIGNVIVSIIARTHPMKQSYEFLLFACIMFIDMIIFAYMAYRFRPPNPYGEYRNYEISSTMSD